MVARVNMLEKLTLGLIQSMHCEALTNKTLLNKVTEVKYPMMTRDMDFKESNAKVI